MGPLRLAVLLTAIAVPASGYAAETAPHPIRLNQAGLLAEGPKIAIIPSPEAAPLAWQVRDANGTVQAAGQTQPLGMDADSGQSLQRVDFTRLTSRGDGFTLTVGNATSRPFSLGDGPYAALKRDALAFFYHQRAGTPIEARLVGERWARPAGHAREVAACFDGTDKAGNHWPGCRHRLDVTGGWYDAGDHGKYVVNGGISVWTLLNLHERQQKRNRVTAFPDGSAAMPEAGNGVDDLLDEVRWQMDFMLAMQVPDGTRMSLPLGPRQKETDLRFTAVDVSGMAHHKVADERWTALPMPPHLDPERRLLYPPSTAATLNLAATAAQAARVWRTIDPAFADLCLTAARRAWAAAQRVPDALAIGDVDGSGGYGDNDLSDEFFWAAAELLATTGEPAFAGVLLASPHSKRGAVAEPSWGQTASLGVLTLLLHPEWLDAATTDRLRRATVTAADGFLTQRGGYGQPLTGRGYGWGSNATLMNRAIVLAYAHDLTGQARYRDAVIDVADYLLGRNPLDISYVSGYGARAMQHPHHRFWAPSLDPTLPPPPPGVVSGGPNITSMGKEAKTKLGDCAPQTCWLDDIDLFTLNEVTINWNAPLVWLAAYLDER